MKGIVLASRGAYCELALENGKQCLATLRGRMKAGRPGGKQEIVTGDEVEVTTHGEDEPVIERIFPRRTLIERRDGLHGRGSQPLAANVDRALVVFAASRPDARVASMDRYLVSVEFQDIAVTLAFNKWDLAGDPASRLLEIYSAAGYSCITLDTLREPQSTREAVLSLSFTRLYVCGPSGVGKTTILNTVMPPSDRAAVGEVNDQTGKGRHTTTAISLRPVDNGRFVVDTPGLSTLMLHLEPNNLKHFYREFAVPAADCRYHSCLHLNEPVCAVRDSVGGKVSAERYESYLSFLAELQENSRKHG